MIVIKLKIGRNEYDIRESDEFMDNGSIIQLLTQSKENVSWGQRPDPTLSKRAIKELEVFEREEVEHEYGVGVSIFSVKGNE